MRIELERMAQEEEEMLEYYRAMGIEEPRRRRKIVVETPAPNVASIPPPFVLDEHETMVESRLPRSRQLNTEIAVREVQKLEDERQKVIDARRERQRELDEEISMREAKRLEGDRRDQISSNEPDNTASESECEDEIIDDITDEDDKYVDIYDDYDNENEDNNVNLAERLRAEEVRV